MTETFAQIHWTVANIFRLVAVLLLTVATLEMVMLLSHYWWRIMPVRKEVGKTIVAPPVWWTFAYHVVVSVIVVTELVGKVQLIAFDGPSTPGTLNTWVSPFITLALVVVVRRFARYYSEILNQVESDHIRQKR